MGSNKGLLLDTQVFLWWMGKSKKLSKDVASIIRNSRTNVYVSVGSIWEMVIKAAKGKLKIPKNIKGGIERSGFAILPIELSHVLEIAILPLFHKDPFDRLLIAQSRSERLTLVTSDRKMWKYKLSILKC